MAEIKSDLLDSKLIFTVFYLFRLLKMQYFVWNRQLVCIAVFLMPTAQLILTSMQEQQGHVIDSWVDEHFVLFRGRSVCSLRSWGCVLDWNFKQTFFTDVDSFLLWPDSRLWVLESCSEWLRSATVQLLCCTEVDLEIKRNTESLL